MRQYNQSQVALGSVIVLNIVTDKDETFASRLMSELWLDIFKFERQFSRFLSSSELSIFNRSAGQKQRITPEFKNLLEDVQKISIKTSGLFNPFILPSLQAAGYDHSLVAGYENDNTDDHSSKTVVSMSQLRLGQNWASIPYGTALDLGGYGKGYLADYLATKLRSQVNGYWLSLGGDVALGGTDENNSGWKISIQKADALDASADVGYLITRPNEYFSFATSGVTTRKGVKNNRAWHHLIDPRTLKPAKTDVLLATVGSSSALYADVMASCAVILGSKKALDFLKDKGIKTALLQLTKSSSPSVINLGKRIKLE